MSRKNVRRSNCSNDFGARHREARCIMFEYMSQQEYRGSERRQYTIMDRPSLLWCLFYDTKAFVPLYVVTLVHKQRPKTGVSAYGATGFGASLIILQGSRWIEELAEKMGADRQMTGSKKRNCTVTGVNFLHKMLWRRRACLCLPPFPVQTWPQNLTKNLCSRTHVTKASCGS